MRSTIKLAAIKESHTGLLVACEEAFRAKIEQAEAPLRFATTSKVFVAEGWVPADRTKGVSEALDKATGGKVFVTELPVDPVHDAVPVEYNNPSFAKPAQMLMDIYSRPMYTEVDPTLMLAIVFPIFFGLILGDVGYGILLLIMCFALRRVLKGDDAREFLVVLRNASISSIIFGILFSEFLGFELPWAADHLLPAPQHRGSRGGRAGTCHCRTDGSCHLDWNPAYHARAGAGHDQPCTPGSRGAPGKGCPCKPRMDHRYVGYPHWHLVDVCASLNAGPEQASRCCSGASSRVLLSPPSLS